MSELHIRSTRPEDSGLILELMNKYWGGEPLIVRAKAYYPSHLDGLLALQNGEIVGFLIYDMQGADCEIVVFEVLDKWNGIGTQMLGRLKQMMQSMDCRRIHLMTTNDNVDALRFYQRRGFHICGIHLDSMKASRAMKPGIPMSGEHDIPLRDEIDLECCL